MEPVRVDPLMGVMNFLATGMKGPHEQISTKVSDTIVVDTSLPRDTNIWETGIERTEIEDKWVIVEQYQDKEHAEVGHKRWSDQMAEFPDYPLKDIENWSLDSLKEKP